MKIKTLLEEEIVKEIEELSKTKVGTDEYKLAVEGVTKLMDRAIEMDKVNKELEHKIESRNIETELRLQELHDERKDRFVKNCIAVGTFLGGAIITIGGTYVCLNFEKEGTITTFPGRKHIGNLFNFK